jgi:hypothetical protein
VSTRKNLQVKMLLVRYNSLKALDLSSLVWM